ncbi:hypothetical protein EMCRGX_G018927 [Ephydatia muelleri]
MAVLLEYLKRKVIEWRFTKANFVLNITLLLHFTMKVRVFVESNAESLGSDIDAADDEDDSYAEAENDADCKSDTDGDLNAGVPQDFLRA